MLYCLERNGVGRPVPTNIIILGHIHGAHSPLRLVEHWRGTDHYVALIYLLLWWTHGSNTATTSHRWYSQDRGPIDQGHSSLPDTGVGSEPLCVGTGLRMRAAQCEVRFYLPSTEFQGKILCLLSCRTHSGWNLSPHCNTQGCSRVSDGNPFSDT
jgi:hypothetical protein